MIRPLGDQPPTGLSAAQGVATLRSYWVFSVTFIELLGIFFQTAPISKRFELESWGWPYFLRLFKIFSDLF
jgi:hypothetical protein